MTDNRFKFAPGDLVRITKQYMSQQKIPSSIESPSEDEILSLIGIIIKPIIEWEYASPQIKYEVYWPAIQESITHDEYILKSINN